MRTILGILFLGFLLASCNNKFAIQTVEKFTLDETSKNFIGVWKFVERLDENGKKIDTIWHGQAHEIANGPLTTFYADGTYSMKFTPKNTDTGKWIYYSETKTMILQLLVDPNSWPGSDVVKRKLAVKFNDGKYYEKLEYKILNISPDTLKYHDYLERNMIYKKIK